jgi:integrase
MQRGTIVLRGKMWTLFYYDTDATGKRVRTSVKLAAKGKEYPTPAKVQSLADKILTPLNNRQLQPEASLPLTEFIENRYFPAAETELRPSTLTNYKQSIYYPHLKERLKNPPIKLRDFRTVHGQRLLRTIPEVGHLTLLHIKNFLSGVFKFALREGVLDGTNPMAHVTVPGRPKKFKGAAYTLAEVARMLEDLDAAMYHVLDDREVDDPMQTRDADKYRVPVKNRKVYETAADVVAMLSVTGLRQSEIRGLRWSDWDEAKQTLSIERAVWQTRVGPTKNPASQNTIPVLPLLQDLLRSRRERVKPKPSDYIFAGERKGTPLDFHNLANRVIKPALENGRTMKKVNGEFITDQDSGVQWEGFHGFRRGLASNLFGLGVNPKVIQAILRHGDVSTTLQFYVQTPDSESRAALEKLEESIKAMQ